MTVIAVRDGVMASDGQRYYERRIIGHDVRKVVRLKDGRLVGGSGSREAIDRFVKTLCAGEPDHSLLGMPNLDSDVIVLSEDCGITVHSHGGPLDVGKPEFFAIGFGADVALGALEMGASAREAVAAACKWSKHCGGKIRSLSIKTGKPL